MAEPGSWRPVEPGPRKMGEKAARSQRRCRDWKADAWPGPPLLAGVGLRHHVPYERFSFKADIHGRVKFIGRPIAQFLRRDCGGFAASRWLIGLSVHAEPALPRSRARPGDHQGSGPFACADAVFVPGAPPNRT